MRITWAMVSEDGPEDPEDAPAIDAVVAELQGDAWVRVLGGEPTMSEQRLMAHALLELRRHGQRVEEFHLTLPHRPQRGTAPSRSPGRATGAVSDALSPPGAAGRAGRGCRRPGLVVAATDNDRFAEPAVRGQPVAELDHAAG